MKFLLVEDYPSIQDIYREVIEDNNHKVDVVSDGEAALKKLKDNTYDLIILDILLPKVDGLEFMKRLVARPGDRPKVLALSDFDKPELVKEMRQLGVVDYLIKVNYTPHQLVKLLEMYASGELPDDTDEPTS
ncbi:MAG TPA: response regulator [Candidatus Saccharimonadales bacterium]